MKLIFSLKSKTLFAKYREREESEREGVSPMYREMREEGRGRAIASV